MEYVECPVCSSPIDVSGIAEQAYEETKFAGEDGRYEINNEIIVIENGEVIERYMAPDENQMVLPI